MGLVIGVTGGIASGKTTVANMFHQHFGIDIVDADVIAREVVAIGSTGLSAIREHFGKGILQSDGTLDRAKLREIIFSQPSEKTWLDNLLHPMIRQTMKQALSETTSPYALLVIPLMVENGLESMADKVLVVDVDEETQISRTMNRDDIDRVLAKKIISAQASRQQRLSIADDIIDNTVSNEQLFSIIEKLNQKYLAMSGKNL